MERRSPRRRKAVQVLAFVASAVVVTGTAIAEDIPLDLGDTATRAVVVVWSGTNGECVTPDCRFPATVRFEAGEAVIDVPNAYFKYASLFDVNWRQEVKLASGTPVDLSGIIGSSELRIHIATGIAMMESYAWSELWLPYLPQEGSWAYFRNEPASTQNRYTGDWGPFDLEYQDFFYEFSLLPYDPSHTTAGRDWAYCENRHSILLQNPGLEEMIWEMHPGRYCNLEGVRYDGATGFLRVAGAVHLYQVDAYGEGWSSYWELYEPLEGTISISTAGGMLLFESNDPPSVPTLTPPALGLLAALMLAGAGQAAFGPSRQRAA